MASTYTPHLSIDIFQWISFSTARHWSMYFLMIKRSLSSLCHSESRKAKPENGPYSWNLIYSKDEYKQQSEKCQIYSNVNVVVWGLYHMKHMKLITRYWCLSTWHQPFLMSINLTSTLFGIPAWPFSRWIHMRIYKHIWASSPSGEMISSWNLTQWMIDVLATQGTWTLV